MASFCCLKNEIIIGLSILQNFRQISFLNRSYTIFFAITSGQLDYFLPFFVFYSKEFLA